MRAALLIFAISVTILPDVGRADVTSGDSADAPSRGLWFWGKPTSEFGATNVVGNAKPEAEALATFRRWHVQRLYGSYAAAMAQRPTELARWNRKLHQQGVRSEFLFSDNGAITAAGRANLLQ